MTMEDSFFGVPPQGRNVAKERWPLCLGDEAIYKLVRRMGSNDDIKALEITQPFQTEAALDAWWTTTALQPLRTAWLAEVDKWVGEGKDLDPCAYASE